MTGVQTCALPIYPIDALSVARAVLREPDLPVACHDATSRELKLLVDESGG